MKGNVGRSSMAVAATWIHGGRESSPALAHEPRRLIVGGTKIDPDLERSRDHSLA